MLTLPSSVRVYLAVDPVNMHLSFDRLAGIRSGWCRVYKRLERGTFQIPTRADGRPVRRELTPTELGLILEGVDLRLRARRVRSGRSIGRQ